MKIFIVGAPQSGRTTVAKALCQSKDYQYIEAVSWVRSTFREPKEGEYPQQYSDEFHAWFSQRLKINPNLITDNICNSINAYGKYAEDAYRFVIDGIQSPRDFVSIFDYNKDLVVFLNRTNNEAEYRDYQNIGVSVMRDYCFWLSSADLLPREQWLEYNFAIPGEDSDWIKPLGHKNSVFIVKSTKKVISHLQTHIDTLKVKA